MKHYFKQIIALFFFFSTTLAAQPIHWQELTIPMPEADPKGLETILVWPNTPGKHPLALISHGSPRDAKERAEMTAVSFLPIAMEFARRGFAAAVVLRRGYGNSGGNWVESFGHCQETHYLQSALESSKDLHAAIRYLATLPQVDTSRMIAVGVSAGGFATVALTADEPPKGLMAAISFAGGRGSPASNTVCQEDLLISTFGELGKTSRVPMLWIYAENDHFFNPETAKQFYTAFKNNGGNATFIQTEKFGDEGHYLFSALGIPVWTPLVDDFLKKQHLTLLKQPLPISIPKLNPPSQLSAKNQKVFTTYLLSAPHKAFAVADDGAFGWRSGRRTVEDAKNAALSYCQKYTTAECKIYSIDDKAE